MIRAVSDGFPLCPWTYRRPMKTHAVAPRTATTDRTAIRHEGRLVSRRSRLVAAATGLTLTIGILACSPSTSSTLPSVAIPSVDVSAAASVAASVAAGAALTALDQVDAAITANTNASGLTADEATSLTTLSAGIRTALTTGDTTAARTAVDGLSSKVDAVAAKLNTDAGAQLKSAIAALKAALPAS